MKHMIIRKKEEDSQEQINSIKTKLMVTTGEVGGEMGEKVMGIKPCTCDEHQVLCVSVESLNYTTESNITLFVNQLEFEYKLKKYYVCKSYLKPSIFVNMNKR